MDFALWKRAEPEHIMRWPSPWGDGFPGWHLECSAMGKKYLGGQFDIHGGGMDLLFPHHECEVAQSVAATGHAPARYWVHNNMVTIDGQKMGKSLGNFITLEELFSGQHARLSHAYSPRVVRFFILQAHYRSTLDFSEAALEASGKGLDRLVEVVRRAARLQPAENGPAPIDVADFIQKSWGALLDDMNTPVAIAHLFDFSKQVAAVERGEARV